MLRRLVYVGVFVGLGASCEIAPEDSCAYLGLVYDPVRDRCICAAGMVAVDGACVPVDGGAPDAASPRDGCRPRVFFRDADGDGFGVASGVLEACTAPEGFASVDGDCDDACADCHPGASEVCDEAMRDENCSMGANEGCGCESGNVRPCPDGTDVGECVVGTQTCEGGAWGSCVGGVTPRRELCDAGPGARDENCDGVANEGCGIRAIAAGSAHSCALRGNGEILCWGSGARGQLGNGTIGAGVGSPLPTLVSGVSDAVELVAGYDHACARRSDGSVACWGANDYGQLGDRSTMDRPTPVAVTGLADAISLAAGARHTCAVRVGGSVVCWGHNGSGQLADGATRSTPGPVTGIDGVVELAAGSEHTCARTSAGRAFCWGLNAHGQLGTGATSGPVFSPVGVSSLVAVLRIDAGGFHTCAHAAAGVYCWGDNRAGEVGDGSMAANRPSPTLVMTAPIADLGVGDGHSCITLEDGRVVCWGDNNLGQVGSGAATTIHRSPTYATGISDSASVHAGAFHTCSVRAAGGVMCWGDNGSGQLGDGTYMRRRAAVTLPTLPW